MLIASHKYVHRDQAATLPVRRTPDLLHSNSDRHTRIKIVFYYYKGRSVFSQPVAGGDPASGVPERYTGHIQRSPRHQLYGTVQLRYCTEHLFPQWYARARL